MEQLEQKIRQFATMAPGGIVRVDSFLNHQIDTAFVQLLAKEFARRFSGLGVNKIITVEASGIAVAALTGLEMGGIPAVFAKKAFSANLGSDAYYSTTIHSFTKGIDCDLIINKKYIGPQDKVIIIDDFLATGEAILGLMRILREAKAEVKGVGAVIEKTFQGGGDRLRERGILVESLARLAMENGNIAFVGNPK